MTHRSELCPTCGAKMVEHKHGLSKGIIRSLYIVAKAQEITNPVKLRKTKLTYSQRANLLKLQYWRLIARANPDKDSGEWYITEKGFQFLRGEISLPHSVRTFRNEVQKYEGNNLFVMEVTGGWKFASEYAHDAQPHREPGQGSLL
jgi:hypothetical protein